MRQRIGVYGVAVGNGSILLTQLSSGEPDAGRWTLPGGGMDFGETPHQTLEREFYEETGLQPEIGELFVARSDVHPRPDGDIHHVQVVYRVTAVGQPRVIEVDGSTSDVQWVPLQGVAPLTTVPLLDAVMVLL